MSLADDIGNSFAATGQRLGVKAATLIKVTPGTRTPGSLSSGTNPTETSYQCSGFVESYSTFAIANSLAGASDRKISLFAATIPGGVVPDSGDKIIIDGTTYRVQDITGRDPAGALFECRCRT